MFKSQRVALDNWERLREMIDGIVEERLDKYSRGEQNGDPDCLLELLMMSDVYQGSVRKIANELMIGMLASNETSRNTSVFAICHMTKQHHHRSMVQEEIRNCLSKYGLASSSDLTHKHTMPSDLEFLSWVISETLRFNPPIPSTEQFIVTKDCRLGKYDVKKGVHLSFYIHGVHHNPNEWQQPELFNPSRFDPSHPMFKTPSGKNRHPMSYIPFSFGERMCLGYQFGKVMLPTLISKIVSNFDFEFVD